MVIGDSSTDWKSARVMVTGGLGFIGSNLIRRLLQLEAKKVASMDCRLPGSGANEANLADVAHDVDVHEVDLRQPELYEHLLTDCTHVFHLAAQTGHVDSMRDPVRDLSINALGTLALLEVCRRQCPDAALVFASTRQLYGAARTLPVGEDHPLCPPDVNAVGKLCAEELLQVYQRIYAMRPVTLRLTNTYGPRMRISDARQMFLGIWIRNLLEGKPIAVFGDGLQRRDLVYVDDVVAALLLSTDRAFVGKTFNVGSEQSTTLLELANILCEVGGSDSIVQLVPFPPERKVIDIGDYVGNYGLFRSATGWNARTDLRTGLASTIDYYRRAGAQYRDSP